MGANNGGKRAKRMSDGLFKPDPIGKWFRERRFAKKFPEPSSCSICGDPALRQVRGVGFCKQHYAEAVAAATKQIGLA